MCSEADFKVEAGLCCCLLRHLAAAVDLITKLLQRMGADSPLVIAPAEYAVKATFITLTATDCQRQRSEAARIQTIQRTFI